MKSLGKMRYDLVQKDYELCIHMIYLNRNDFSFMEVVDVLWGIVRMGREGPHTWKSRSDSQLSHDVNALFHLAEGKESRMKVMCRYYPSKSRFGSDTSCVRFLYHFVWTLLLHS